MDGVDEDEGPVTPQGNFQPVPAYPNIWFDEGAPSGFSAEGLLSNTQDGEAAGGSDEAEGSGERPEQSTPAPDSVEFMTDYWEAVAEDAARWRAAHPEETTVPLEIVPVQYETASESATEEEDEEEEEEEEEEEDEEEEEEEEDEEEDDEDNYESDFINDEPDEEDPDKDPEETQRELQRQLERLRTPMLPRVGGAGGASGSVLAVEPAPAPPPPPLPTPSVFQRFMALSRRAQPPPPPQAAQTMAQPVAPEVVPPQAAPPPPPPPVPVAESRQPPPAPRPPVVPRSQRRELPRDPAPEIQPAPKPKPKAKPRGKASKRRPEEEETDDVKKLRLAQGAELRNKRKKVRQEGPRKKVVTEPAEEPQPTNTVKRPKRKTPPEPEPPRGIRTLPIAGAPRPQGSAARRPPVRVKQTPEGTRGNVLLQRAKAQTLADVRRSVYNEDPYHRMPGPLGVGEGVSGYINDLAAARAYEELAKKGEALVEDKYGKVKKKPPKLILRVFDQRAPKKQKVSMFAHIGRR